MVHDITIRENGRAEAAFSLTPAWHGLGVVLDHPMFSKEALEAAGLNWEVIQKPLFIQDQNSYKQIEGLANVRSDTNSVLGIVTERYKVVQNIEAFSFLDNLIENHEMTYEAAFSLSGGKKVVLLGRLPQVDQIVSGDDLLRYVLLSLHHDGTGSIKFGPTSVRVVCANTYALALSRGTINDLDRDNFTKEVAIRHLGDVSSKLEKVKQILAIANKEFDEFTTIGKELAKYRLNEKEWETFLDTMCPRLPRHDPDWTELREKRLEETRNALTEAYHNPRQTLPGIEETAWAAFCSIVEHIDHLPRRGATPQQKAEARFNVCLYGPGRDMKTRALETLKRIAGIPSTSAA